MVTLREDWYGSFDCVLYISVNQKEFDAIATYGWQDNEPFSVAPQFHNYDGFVEKSKSGVQGDASKGYKPYPERTIYYILNGKLV